MSSKRYPEEFRAEAVKQIVDRGYSVQEVSQRLGVSAHSLYKWLKASGRWGEQVPDRRDGSHAAGESAPQGGAEAGRGRAGHSKKGRRILCQDTRVKYAFIRDHRQQFRVSTMCRVLRVHRSRFYAWLERPLESPPVL